MAEWDWDPLWDSVENGSGWIAALSLLVLSGLAAEYKFLWAKEEEQKRSDSETCFVVNTHILYLPMALYDPWLVCAHADAFADVIPSGFSVSSLLTAAVFFCLILASSVLLANSRSQIWHYTTNTKNTGNHFVTEKCRSCVASFDCLLTKQITSWPGQPLKMRFNAVEQNKHSFAVSDSVWNTLKWWLQLTWQRLSVFYSAWEWAPCLTSNPPAQFTNKHVSALSPWNHGGRGCQWQTDNLRFSVDVWMEWEMTARPKIST